jgi:diguanylate cyclase (GGDEF)-like protein
MAADLLVNDTTVLKKLTIESPPKVLLVDDDDIAVEHLRNKLEDAGFEVDSVCAGEKVLSRLQSNFSPVVILDRNMGGGLNGLDVCKAIRQQQFPGYVYVILLTVQDREEDILEGLNAGADDYLSKRSSTAQLIARLRTAQRILGLERSLREMVQERRKLAMTDSLTGMHNRRHLIREGEREIERVRRSRGNLSVLLVDIDFFKAVNDTFGHPVGDEVLINVARHLQQSLPRSTDWCARMGGEEFAVILTETDLAGAAVVAEHLRASLAAKTFLTSAGSLRVTISIGVSGSQTVGDQLSINSLLSHADKLLYEAKANGRNRVSMPASANHFSTQRLLRRDA